ncbi:MAG TPA: VOC family protein [Candidatus Baltobacteraceae bacterium]|jgi:catechol-2,3-dioxygenase
MIRIKRLNHAVLFVRDLDRSAAFYRDVLGFEEISRMGESMAFMRAAGSENHHDLGLARVGMQAPNPPQGSVGLYHLAWQTENIEDLAAVQSALRERAALTGASDHGATKSIYGTDPDGNEFEVMWAVPREQWGQWERSATTRPLDLPREIAKFGRERASSEG